MHASTAHRRSTIGTRPWAGPASAPAPKAASLSPVIICQKPSSPQNKPLHMKLTIDRLSKTYSNGVRALYNVSLALDNGMFGLLGPNGAGKSSLMRTIATLQEPDTGSIRLDDLDVL